MASLLGNFKGIPLLAFMFNGIVEKTETGLALFYYQWLYLSTWLLEGWQHCLWSVLYSPGRVFVNCQVNFYGTWYFQYVIHNLFYFSSYVFKYLFFSFLLLTSLRINYEYFLILLADLHIYCLSSNSLIIFISYCLLSVTFFLKCLFSL